MTVDDVEATWRFRQLAEVQDWIGFAPPTLEDYRAAVTAPARLTKTLVVEHEDAVIGDLMLWVGDGWAQAEVAEEAKGVQAELGWSFDPAYGGRGLATEAVGALIDVCFTHLGLRRVTAHCFEANQPSWRLMERLGMRREEEHRRSGLHRSRGWLDGLGYALLAEEWAARR